eukprot:CAMPEP_0183326976 /NCGR_PEP_ID=MMETSP0160_2-20130417/83523_1 /TAXON_ID=2839 ORGANISM="Odontella Sinensis, Strain Grunow 1884" /NCGR_SAMPLE_ID=MMETSP0160_2 /ASSEMBLY_ACC=CAM_ASM_000250 /LENGTH=276 /DNA_ID=CAMNT_0025495083 /DNA_START=25 /DNA_END=851 /DNA_ORIENTATION=+
MKLAIAALLAGSAAAFAPAQSGKASTALNMAFESELGAQPPLGFFDPLGMLADADQERFDRLRYVEVKHGRIAQLAFLGNIITRAGVKLPGDIDYSGTSFDSIGNGWAAISGDSAIPSGGLLQIVAFVGFLELFIMKESASTASVYVEVKHGRIAQLAFLGQIVTRYGIHLPGDIDYSGTSFDSIANGWAAISGPNAVPQAGLIQIFLFVGFLELAVMKDVTGESEFPGDFRNGALDFGWDTFDEETKLSKRAIELNNGRAAMMGILGLMVHEQLG